MLQDLGLEKVVPPYYNIQSGRFEIQNKTLPEGLDIETAQDNLDAVDLARIKALKQ